MTTTRLYRSARLAGAALAALALAIAGCSSSSDQGAGSSTGNPTPVGTTSAQPGSTTAPTSAPASSGSGQSGAAVPDQAALRAELPDAIKSSGVLHLGALWETPPYSFLPKQISNLASCSIRRARGFAYFLKQSRQNTGLP